MNDITLVFLKANLKPYDFPTSLFEVSVEVEIENQDRYMFCYHVEMVYQEQLYMEMDMHYRVDKKEMNARQIDDAMYQIHPYLLEIIEALLKQNQVMPQLLTS